MNGYNKNQIRRVIRKARSRSQKQNRCLDGTTITLPYIKGTTDVIARILRKKNIGVTFAPPNSIGRMLDTSKDPVEPLKRKGVYSVPCSCEIPYIGEIGRSVEVRLKEHCADIMHDRHQKSALAEHAHHSWHHICIEETKLITREEHYKRWKIMEAIEIEKFPLNLNRDDGLKLNECWRPKMCLLKDTNTHKKKGHELIKKTLVGFLV